MGKSAAQTFVALFATGLFVVLWSIGLSVAWFPLTSVNVERGERLFQSRCASCHAVQPGAGSSNGPSLERIGAVAQDRVPGLSAEQFLLQSIQQPAAHREPGEQGVMPADISAGLTPGDVLSLVAFLKTRQGTLDTQRLLALREEVETPGVRSVAAVDLATVEAGRRLFSTKGQCSKCHLLRDVPGFDLRAPSLLAAGHHDAAFLRESIRDPSRHILSSYAQWNILLTSGRQIQGRLLRRESDSIDLLVDESGALRIRTVALRDIDEEDEGLPIMHSSATSTMPKYAPDNLTDLEVEQIVAFLKTLQ